MRFLKIVEGAATLEGLGVVSRRWEDFDCELATAILKIAKGAAKREMIMHQEAKARDCDAASGRELLWLFL